ncbi:hypothetical protein ACFPM7_09270 [Actinokineospora guangxiensis]|uniref:Uncharacterized protein n=1 Tax=Actinokineospora guangxiensis TaxID=1490288 RepID=A0ABW0EIJ7_9PSEU
MDDAHDLVIAAATGALQYSEVAARLSAWTRPTAASPRRPAD